MVFPFCKSPYAYKSGNEDEKDIMRDPVPCWSLDYSIRSVLVSLEYVENMGEREICSRREFLGFVFEQKES